MVKITKVSVSFSFTKQLKQYEPAKYFSAIEAELDEGDNRDQVVRELFELCKDDIREQADGKRERIEAKPRAAPKVPEFKMNEEVTGDEVRKEEVNIYNAEMAKIQNED